MASSTQPPRPRHELMVPVGQEFALVSSGVVVATVEWRKIHGRMSEYAYAPSQEIAAGLPRLGSDLGTHVRRLINRGELVPAKALYAQLNGCYRVDDHRSGHNRSYLLWIGDVAYGTGPTPNWGMVYHFQGEGGGPPLTSARAVMALSEHPGALIIDSKRAFVQLKNSKTGMNNPVTVWDLGEIYRS